jgi:hypothetical protein
MLLKQNNFFPAAWHFVQCSSPSVYYPLKNPCGKGGQPGFEPQDKSRDLLALGLPKHESEWCS